MPAARVSPLTRKRRVFIPRSRSSKGPPPVARVQTTPTTVAVINSAAPRGRDDLSIGLRVSIVGSGSSAGETGVVERLVAGVIPAAIVRTEAGKSRRIRMVDLVPIKGADQGSQAAQEPETGR